MTQQNNAASLAVKPLHCQKPAIVWIACLLKEAQPLPDGITTTSYERLPGLFKTSDEAMDAGEAAIVLRPDAVGYSAVCVEVPHGF